MQGIALLDTAAGLPPQVDMLTDGGSWVVSARKSSLKTLGDYHQHA